MAVVTPIAWMPGLAKERQGFRVQEVEFGEIQWMDDILHHFETMVETIVSWYLQENHPTRLSPRWCEMDSVHPQSFFTLKTGETTVCWFLQGIESFYFLTDRNRNPKLALSARLPHRRPWPCGPCNPPEQPPSPESRAALGRIRHTVDGHFESHCLLVFTGESSFKGFIGGAGLRPSTVRLRVKAACSAQSAHKPIEETSKGHTSQYL